MTPPAPAPLLVTVIIPAFNEADRIGATVRAAQNLAGSDRVWVVDDGSSDETARHAEEAGAMVVHLSQNSGKAHALTEGVRAALADPEGKNTELLLFLDADLEKTAALASALVEPVQRSEADMTIATFPVKPGKGGGFGAVVRVARWGVKRATGRTMAAPLSGQRCLTLAAWQAAQPLAPGFGVEVALTIDVLQFGLRVQEVPTEMDHRVTGRSFSARLHRARQLRDVLRALAPRLLNPQRTRRP